MPDIPRYNTNVYREFKRECLQFLVSTQVIFGCLLVHRCIDDVTIDRSKVELIWYLSLNVSHRSGNIANLLSLLEVIVQLRDTHLD